MSHHATLCLERPNRHHDLGIPLAGLLGWLRDGYAVYRQRRALLALDERMLKDIGISRADAIREGGTPFWRR